MRYFVQLSYKGTHFHGWQVQPNAVSVQEALNKAFSLKLDQEIYLVGAGRTDAGVHAKEMWAHFDYDGNLPDDLVYHLNRLLVQDIAIQSIVKVEDDAHCRFSATGREYKYYINRSKDPFKQDLAYQYISDLDVAKMQGASNVLLDYQDFTSFSRSNTQTKTNNCDVAQAIWHQEGDDLIFTIRADRFLRNMVRAIVGTILAVGTGKLEIEDFKKIIEAKDRTKAGESAPAHGLFLTKVEYPKEIWNG